MADKGDDLTDEVYQAVIMQAEGRTAEAETAFRAVLEKSPAHPDALHFLGLLQYQKGNADEAVTLIDEAIAADGDSPIYAVNLGKVLVDLERLGEAEEAFRRALRLQPDEAELHFLLGETLRPRRKNAEAEACYRQTLETAGEAPEILYNLGNALKDQHRTDEAIDAYRRAIALDPGFAVAHVHLAFALLLKGDYEAGWEEYEWRWKVPTFTSPFPDFPQPGWDGGPLEGRRLLLHAEQGFGDTLQFARYAGVAAESGATVVLRCQPALARLMKTATGVEAVVADDQSPPAFDCHAPLLSMPRLTGTTLETLPADVPYLAPEPDLAREWTERLADAPGLKVGIAWQGTAERRGNPARACPLVAFRPLLENPAISLFSLQKETPKADRPLPDRLTDLSRDLRDFADTAAILSALDLVVTIDTAVAHLAGALGRPTWVLLSTAADWRWLMERADSPWYPTARLFRQTQERQWDDVLARVAAKAASVFPAKG